MGDYLFDASDFYIRLKQGPIDKEAAVPMPTVRRSVAQVTAGRGGSGKLSKILESMKSQRGSALVPAKVTPKPKMGPPVRARTVHTPQGLRSDYSAYTGTKMPKVALHPAAKAGLIGAGIGTAGGAITRAATFKSQEKKITDELKNLAAVQQYGSGLGRKERRQVSRLQEQLRGNRYAQDDKKKSLGLAAGAGAVGGAAAGLAPYGGKKLFKILTKVKR